MAEITVMASQAFQAAYLQLVPQFERATGHRVITSWVPTVDMMTRLKAGEPVDLVIMAGGHIDELTTVGLIVAGARRDLARSGIGLGIPAGAPKPDIGTVDAFKDALLAARSLAYSTGPSGVYLVGLFERLGLADVLKPKTQQVKDEPIGALLARGDVELGFQQICELLPFPGVDYIGPLPDELQRVTVFSAGLHRRAEAPDAAQALVTFLTALHARPVIERTGMQVG